MSTNRPCGILLGGLLAAACLRLPAQAPIQFADVTESAGLARHLEAWCWGHAAGWGDVDGDGRPDLYIGAFANRPIWKTSEAPIPNQLFLNTGRGFTVSPETAVRMDRLYARATASIFVDLDNDGDLDLVVSNHGGVSSPASLLMENLGGGRLRDATPVDGDWPRQTATRNVAAYDFNDDGLLDLVFCDGKYSNWRSGEGRLIVLENRGRLAFQGASAKYGFPPGDTAGMGLAVGDVNEDGRFDFFVADCNRLFVSGPQGKYRESQPGFFLKPPPDRRDSHACGAAFGDLDGDGLLDLVTTEHGQPSNLRVYLNRGIREGAPRFENVSEAAGLGEIIAAASSITGLPVKGTHVAIVDFDNDGRRDILVTMLWRDVEGRPEPFVARNLGNQNGVPRFQAPPLDQLLGYYAPGAVADYDRDGRVDLFLPTWGIFSKGRDERQPDIPSILFRNTSPSGHWLTVRVQGKKPGLNPLGIGATVRAYQSGGIGDPKRLVQRQDIAVGTGYSSGEEALAHLGLGKVSICDIEIVWAGQRIRQNGVAADQMVNIVFQ